MKKETELKKRVLNDQDYIYNPKMGNSMKKFLNKYPDGVDDDKKIAKMLVMSVSEMNKRYLGILKRVRKKLGIEVN